MTEEPTRLIPDWLATDILIIVVALAHAERHQRPPKSLQRPVPDDMLRIVVHGADKEDKVAA